MPQDDMHLAVEKLLDVVLKRFRFERYTMASMSLFSMLVIIVFFILNLRKSPNVAEYLTLTAPAGSLLYSINKITTVWKDSIKMIIALIEGQGRKDK